MSKEAMKLALEALNNATSYGSLTGADWVFKQVDEAIKALEEALAKQEQGEPVALKVYRGELCYKSQADDQSFGMWCPVTQDLPFPEGTNFYTTSQPKQEQGEPDDLTIAYMSGYYDGKKSQQRTWVGLTGEEIDSLSLTAATKSDISDIEAKLKAKNERLEKNT